MEMNYFKRYTSQHLKEPRYVIKDKKGNLYVACIVSNDIQRISVKSKFIDVILKWYTPSVHNDV